MFRFVFENIYEECLHKRYEMPTVIKITVMHTRIGFREKKNCMSIE